MNKILSYVRRCVEDYDMIQAGDRVIIMARSIFLQDLDDILR